MKQRFIAAVTLLALLAALACPSASALNTGSYTIYFETGGGTGIPIIASTSSSGKLTSLPEPVMSGYKFEGWYTDELEGDKITLSTEFSSDATIYARWLPLSGTQTSVVQAPAAADGTAFRLKAHAGTLLVAGTMLVTLLVLYTR